MSTPYRVEVDALYALLLAFVQSVRRENAIRCYGQTQSSDLFTAGLSRCFLPVPMASVVASVGDTGCFCRFFRAFDNFCKTPQMRIYCKYCKKSLSKVYSWSQNIHSYPDKTNVSYPRNSHTKDTEQPAFGRKLCVRWLKRSVC